MFLVEGFFICFVFLLLILFILFLLDEDVVGFLVEFFFLVVFGEVFEKVFFLGLGFVVCVRE